MTGALARRAALLRWIAVGIVLLFFILAPFAIWEEQILELSERALADDGGAFVVGILAILLLAADVVLPIPSSLVGTFAGALLGAVAGTIVVWLGMTLGCLFGYWLGSAAGRPIVRRVVGEGELERATALAGKVGFGTLVALRAVPVLAEASVLAAGATHMSWRTFATATGLANLGIAAAYSTLGALAFETESFLLVFAAAIAVPMIAVGLFRLFRRRNLSAPD